MKSLHPPPTPPHVYIVSLISCFCILKAKRMHLTVISPFKTLTVVLQTAHNKVQRTDTKSLHKYCQITYQ